ncbi:MAG: hypothetical protein ACRDGA_11440 [Bacteroidota bacterium]
MDFLSSALLCCALTLPQQRDTLKPSPQNPSPMVEQTREHGRVPQQDYAGVSYDLSGPLARPANVFIPQQFIQSHQFDLLIHFHGASFVVHHVATTSKQPLIAVTVNLGSGSSVYGAPFADSTAFSAFLDSIAVSVQNHLNHPPRFGRIILSGFSAGYGAVRKILSTFDNYRRADAVLLLDGIHASYIPEGRVLAEGGKVDSTGLLAFLRYADDASRPASRKKFMITHSEIFPGTFVSTTEACNYLLNALGIKQQATLQWGPLGMQQLSIARRNGFTVLGFAGNTAPDHIDHFHALSYFLGKLLDSN